MTSAQLASDGARPLLEPRGGVLAQAFAVSAAHIDDDIGLTIDAVRGADHRKEHP